MTGIRILADDLTGALDTAAAFSGNVPVYIDCPPVLAGKDADPAVSVVATPTRDVAPDTLPGFLEPAVRWFTAGGLSFKKVDSLLRGNTFEEIAWLFRHARFERVVFAPAFPAQGRITCGDRQWIARPGRPREALAVPLQPEFSRLGMSSSALLEERADAWVPEVATDGELDEVVRKADPAGGTTLWVGSAGLGNALARHFGLSPQSGSVAPLSTLIGPTVLISASFQPVFREQWSLLRADRAVQAVAEAGDAAQIGSAIERACAGAGEVWFDLSPRETIDASLAIQRLQATTRLLVERLPKPGQLLVVGGDTLLGLCRASGAAGLLAHPSIRPGWGCARLMGGVWDGVPCYSRSGAFGLPDDLVGLYSTLSHATSS